MDKNEYLHELGMRLLLSNCASISEMTDTLMDYSGLLPEQIISDEVIEKLGTPKSAARELRDGNKVRQVLFAAAAALLAAALLRWAVLLFESFWRPAGVNVVIVAAAAAVIIFLLFWTAARVYAQSWLEPLQKRSAGERAALWIFCLLPPAAVGIVYFCAYRVVLNADIITASELLAVGPKVTAMIEILSAMCLLLAAYALIRVFRGAPSWSLSFAVSICSSATLLSIRHTLAMLAEAEKVWRNLLPSAMPCALGLLLAAASAALIAHGKAEGEKLWTHR